MDPTAGRNTTMVCAAARVMSKGIWLGGSPIHSPTPLILFQLSFISSLTFIIDTFFQYLWQSTVVSQIFSGLVIGPSLLGHQEGFLATFFPMKGHLVLDTLAKFGLIFFLFSIGLKMDGNMMIKPGKQALTLGLSAYFVTLILTLIMAAILKQTITMDEGLGSTIFLIGSSQGLTGFPVIACLLTELKILNTDMGRLALASSMICDFVGISVTAVSFSLMLSANNIMLSLNAFISVIALILLICYVFRPIVLNIRSKMLRDKAGAQETFIILIFLLVLISSLASEVIGQHYIFGPLVFGIAVPDGPPLGTALTQKIDTIATGILYPTFCAMVGLQTNIYAITLKNLGIVGLLGMFGFFSKIISVIVPGFFFNIPLRDCFVLGLILNARGIIELTVYNLWKETEMVNDEMFSLCIIYVVVVTAIVTPLIKYMYDPLKQFQSITRSTIQQQAKQDPELRLLVGILNHENVPSVINLLDVSHADEDNPLTVIAMALVELLGRTTPVLVSHKEQKTVKYGTSIESKIFSALDQLEKSYDEGELEVKAYTSISFYDMMHEDICRVAADEQANIVIVPFHKQWTIDGTVGFSSRAVQNMNVRVLDTAPCSVGILVDRGVMSGTTSNAAQPFGHVGVIFIGGPDDAECLAYGARMVKKRNVHVTVVRYLLFGSEKSKERKDETNLVDEYRRIYSGNARFMYVEEVVRDSEGLATSIRSITECFGLILVGRSHIGSPLVTGMTEWSECPELGGVGDMLASPDFGVTATLLVIQQQKVAGGKWMMKQRKEDHSQSHGGGKPDNWSIP